jgi:hypothetical protein
MRDEQRPSTTGGAPDRRSRSVADMQELINGLREEQQQAKQALHACQQGMCKARGAIMIMLWNGTERSRLERLFQRWVSAALKVNVNAAAYESGQRRSGQRRRAAAQLGAQLSLRSTVPASADAPARLLESASALSRALAADTAGTERRALALEVSLHAAEVRQQQTEARLLRASRARVHESEEREARERAEANVLRLELGVFESALRRTEQALMQAQHSVASHEAALTQLAETSAHAHAQERARAMAAREALIAQTQAQLTEQRASRTSARSQACGRACVRARAPCRSRWRASSPARRRLACESGSSWTSSAWPTSARWPA